MSLIYYYNRYRILIKKYETQNTIKQQKESITVIVNMKVLQNVQNMFLEEFSGFLVFKTTLISVYPKEGISQFHFIYDILLEGTLN